MGSNSALLGKAADLITRLLAAASLVVLLIWVYYSAQILLFGAEFTHVRAQQHATRLTARDP